MSTPGTPGVLENTPWRTPRWLVGAILLVGLELVVLSYVFPVYPATTYGWVLLLALGPPAMFATEWILSGGRLAAPPARRRDDARIGYPDVVVLLLIVLILMLVPVMWWSFARRA